MTTRVRLAEPRDLAELRAILARIADDPDDVRHIPVEPGEVDALVAGFTETIERGAMLVALAPDDAVIGWVTMRWLDRLRLRHAASLGISVDAAHRNRGAGRALMTAAIAWARDRGMRRVELHVMVRNAPAIALYERMGFVHEGRLRGAIRIGDDLHDDLVMSLLL